MEPVFFYSERHAQCRLYCNKNGRLEVTSALNSCCECSSLGMDAHGLLGVDRCFAEQSVDEA